MVNTCSVREKPEQKVYSLLGRLSRLKKNNPGLFVGVGGCVAQQIGEHLWNRFPFVRLVFGSDGVAQVPEAVERLREDPGFDSPFWIFPATIQSGNGFGTNLRLQSRPM